MLTVAFNERDYSRCVTDVGAKTEAWWKSNSNAGPVETKPSLTSPYFVAFLLVPWEDRFTYNYMGRGHLTGLGSQYDSCLHGSLSAPNHW